MMQFSTDFVFDGMQPEPYGEDDLPNPVSVYGKSKLMGEQLVAAASDDHVIVRLSWLFGEGRAAFPEWVVSRAQSQERLEVVSDKVACPTYNMDAAKALLPWLVDRKLAGGIWHYCQPDPCTWDAYAQHVLDCVAGLGVELKTLHVSPINIASLPGLIAQRPPQSALSTRKFTDATGHAPRPWKRALEEYLVRHWTAPMP